MSQSLRINNKDYLTSTELSKKCGYTSDYISKLARDERVLGTRVGRQWFIEPESLRTYLQQLEVEKSLGKEELSRIRKVERQRPVPEALTSNNASCRRNTELLIAGQALSVMVCGALVAVVLASAFTWNLTPQDTLRGAVVIARDVIHPLKLGLSQLALVGSNESPVLRVIVEHDPVLEEETGPRFDRGGAYTDFPVILRGVHGGAPDVHQRFSDDVQLSREGGKWYVQPVIGGQGGSRLGLDDIVGSQ